MDRDEKGIGPLNNGDIYVELNKTKNFGIVGHVPQSFFQKDNELFFPLFFAIKRYRNAVRTITKETPRVRFHRLPIKQRTRDTPCFTTLTRNHL